MSEQRESEEGAADPEDAELFEMLKEWELSEEESVEMEALVEQAERLLTPEELQSLLRECGRSATFPTEAQPSINWRIFRDVFKRLVLPKLAAKRERQGA